MILFDHQFNGFMSVLSKDSLNERVSRLSGKNHLRCISNVKPMHVWPPTHMRPWCKLMKCSWRWKRIIRWNISSLPKYDKTIKQVLLTNLIYSGTKVVWGSRTLGSLEMTHYSISSKCLVNEQPWVVHNLWCHYKLISATIALPLWHLSPLAV